MERFKPFAPLALAFLFFCLTASAHASPVTPERAADTVRGWLRQDHRPLNRRLSGNIEKTDTVKDSAGDALYYVVRMKPAGYVIVAADDQTEPIIAFSGSGNFNPDSSRTIPALLNKDMSSRMKRARALNRAGSKSAARAKWNAFLAGSPNPPPDVEENGNIVVASQIWVPPLLQTAWSQQVDVSLNDAVYNYFTPPGPSGSTNNYPCGCVATALAQEMFYFQYPTGGVGTGSFPITVDGNASTSSLRGGDGLGGPYIWTNMPLSPNLPTTAQAMAIGALTHDAGAAVNENYTATNSAAFTKNCQSALTNVFFYANAAYYEDDNNGITGSNLLNMINPSLDAHLPVILGIEPNGGHCLIADGYGYSAGTLFHHLNTGFAGDDDIWYALPDINTIDQNGDYTMVVACVYNIFTNGTGQIISGRVTDPSGAPVAGAMVSAAKNGGGNFSTTTDANGIYALARIPPNSTYTVTVSNAGSPAVMGTYSTGLANNNSLPSGNAWGANFVLTPPLLALPESGFSTIGPIGGPFSVTAQLYVLTNGSGSAVNWNVSNTNTWLNVSLTNGSLPAATTTNVIVSLAASATNLSSGTHTGAIRITNQNNGLAQQLIFSVSVEAADYPIPVTGYNLDVIVESNAVGGSTLNYADAFDPADPVILPTAAPVCFYENGLAGTNILLGSGPSADGLPPNGLITSLADNATTFQLGPYDGSNVLYLTASAPSGSLVPDNLAAWKSISILAASTQGGGNGTFSIQFSDGSSSTNIPFDASNYLVTNSAGSDAAITNFGILTIGSYNQYYSVDVANPFPALYQTTVDLHALGYDTKPVSSMTFTMPPGGATNMATGVFALSGSQAVFNGNYTINVAASPSGSGQVSGGGSFGPGSTNTVFATANPGYTFVNWTQGGVVVGTSPNYTFIVNGGGTLVANFLSPQYTVIVESAPQAGGTVSGGGIYSAGSQQVLTATPAANFTFIGWTGDATGTNNPLTITVSTNISITANFAEAMQGVTLTLTTNSNLGTVTPNPNGRLYHINQTVTLTAVPKAGNLFSNWTGSVTTNKNPLSIKLTASKAVEANFIPNPFLPARGTYNGLFSATNAVISEQTSGMLKGFTLGPKGTYSGTLMINGAGHGFSGTFSLGLQASNKIVRSAAQGGNLVVQLGLHSGPPPFVTGTVTGTNWIATNLIADLASNTLPSEEYTINIPPDTNNPVSNSIPTGIGYALVTNHLGTAKIIGALADGTAFSQTVPVSAAGDVPLYATIYGNKGALLGWLNLASTNSPGSLAWIHPALKTGLFSNAFTSTNAIALSPWTNPPASTPLPTNLIAIGIGKTNTFAITISNNDKVGLVSGPEPVSGSLNPKTGLISITLGTGKEKQTAYGALLMNASNSGGYFLDKTNAGTIQFKP